jgi:hypothetical protein
MLTPTTVTGSAYQGGGFPLPTEALLYSYIVYLIPLAATIAALATVGKRPGQRLRAAALGAWFASLTWLVSDFIGKPGYFSDYAGTDRNWGAYLFTLLGDLLGIVVVILLLVAFRRSAQRGSWARPRAVPVLMFIGSLVGPAAWYAGLFHQSWPCCSASSFNAYYGTIHVLAGAEAILAVAVAAFVGAYALGVTDRVAGGAIVAGWLAVGIFEYLTFITEGWSFGNGEIAENWGAALVLVATAVLTIVYMRRQPAS